MERINYTNLLLLAAALAVGASCSRKGGTREGLLPEERAAFSKEALGAEEFVRWCADETHELHKTKELSDIRYALSYMPAETMAFLELRKKAHSFAELMKAKEGYSEMSYFNFRIGAKEHSGELLKYALRSPEQYERRVDYLAFRMEKDICLVQDGDTLYPGLYHFERSFEAAPYASVLFGFDNRQFKKAEAFTIVYNDRLFDKGLVKFAYCAQQLIYLPSITAL